MSIRLQEQQQRLTDKESSLQDLKEQIHHIQQNLDHFREAARQQREELIMQHDAVISDHKHETMRLNQLLENERSQCQSLSLELEKQKYQNEKIIDEKQWLNNQSNERYEQITELKQKLEISQQQCNELRTRHTEQYAELERLREQLIYKEKVSSEYKEKWITAQASRNQQEKIISELSKKLNKDISKEQVQ